MNLKPLNWILKRISKRIPAMVMITLAHIASALLGVGMALGSRRVIDGAVSGDMKAHAEMRDTFHRCRLSLQRISPLHI